MATKRKQATKKTARAKAKDRDKRNIDLEFTLPPDLPLLYVDNINVLHTPTEFTVSFMQAQPPLVSEESQWNTIKKIESRCVARIIVSPPKMQLFVNALAANLQKYIQTYIQEDADDGNDNDKTHTDGKAS